MLNFIHAYTTQISFVTHYELDEKILIKLLYSINTSEINKIFDFYS